MLCSAVCICHVPLLADISPAQVHFFSLLIFYFHISIYSQFASPLTLLIPFSPSSLSLLPFSLSVLPLSFSPPSSFLLLHVLAKSDPLPCVCGGHIQQGVGNMAAKIQEQQRWYGVGYCGSHAEFTGQIFFLHQWLLLGGHVCPHKGMLHIGEECGCVLSGALCLSGVVWGTVP